MAWFELTKARCPPVSDVVPCTFGWAVLPKQHCNTKYRVQGLSAARANPLIHMIDFMHKRAAMSRTTESMRWRKRWERSWDEVGKLRKKRKHDTEETRCTPHTKWQSARILVNFGEKSFGEMFPGTYDRNDGIHSVGAVAVLQGVAKIWCGGLTVSATGASLWLVDPKRIAVQAASADCAVAFLGNLPDVPRFIREDELPNFFVFGLAAGGARAGRRTRRRGRRFGSGS